MKKHICRIFVLLLTFTVGFLASPIRFDSVGAGHGATKDGDGYWFIPYKSTYFVKLLHEGENYNSSERAKEILDERINKPGLIEVENYSVLDFHSNRAIISFQTKNNLQGFCILRTRENVLHTICSSSLRHVIKFEEQNFKD